MTKGQQYRLKIDAGHFHSGLPLNPENAHLRLAKKPQVRVMGIECFGG